MLGRFFLKGRNDILTRDWFVYENLPQIFLSQWYTMDTKQPIGSQNLTGSKTKTVSLFGKEGPE
jgi:hypothetical protein